jgi:hypothetical protein
MQNNSNPSILTQSIMIVWSELLYPVYKKVAALQMKTKFSFLHDGND